MKFRLIAVGLVSVLLIWWGQSESESRARREAKQAERASTGQEKPELSPEQPEPESATPTKGSPADLLAGRVRMLGPGGAPISGVRFGDRDGLLRFAGPTGADGWASWTTKKKLPRYVRIMDSLILTKHVLRRPETIIELSKLIPLEVEYVDVATGLVIEQGAARLVRHRADTVHGPNPRVLQVAPIRAGERCDIELDLEPPPGRTTAAGFSAAVMRRVSVLARRARLRIPVWPERDLTLVVQGRDGAAVAGVRLRQIAVKGGEFLETRSEPSDSAGRIFVHGVPDFGPCELMIQLDGMRTSQQVAISGAKELVPLVWEPADEPLKPEPEEFELEFDMLWEEDDGPSPIGVGGGTYAEIEVKLILPDGSPAGGIPVHIPARPSDWPAHTGRRNGTAVLALLPSGRHRVVVDDLALAYEQRDVDAVRGVRSRIQIGPAVGRTLTFESRAGPGTEIDVRAEFGRITPFADGLQDLSAVTGPSGRLVWPRFPTRAVAATASRGTQYLRRKIPAGVASETVTLTFR